MKKYYEDLEDYKDETPLLMMKFMKEFLPTFIFIAGMALLLAICGAIESI